jgi:hypothetical protein
LPFLYSGGNMKIELTCKCGCSAVFDSQWASDVTALVKEWNDKHDDCVAPMTQTYYYPPIYYTPQPDYTDKTIITCGGQCNVPT